MKKLLMAIIILPSVVYATSEPTASPFPDAKKGINIVPIAKLNMPMKKETMKGLRTLAKTGFTIATWSDEEVNFLFSIPKTARQETAEFDKVTNPLDTHLKSTISKIRYSFKFHGIPGISRENTYGFAAAGGYTHEKGWDGIVQFVNIPNIGVCSFTTFAIESVMIYQRLLSIW